jgi:cytochrome c-type biogenesis protein CcmH
VRRAVLLAATLVALLAAAVAAGPAGAATPRTSFNDVEDEVMCDTCNVPLNIAESPRADQERREIRALIAQGLTKQQLKDELVRRYGAEILADPPKRGFSLAVWVVPVVVVLGFVALAAILLPRWRRRAGDRLGATGSADALVPELSPADAARLDEDLARWDRR